MPRRLIESFNYAIEGFIYVLKTQRNMRIHFLIGVLIILLGIIVELSRVELVCLGGIITFVLFAEMVNTAVEHLTDLVKSEQHPAARIVKDISAGAVLLSAVAAAIFGYMLFSGHFAFSLTRGVTRLKESPMYTAIISFIVVLALVIIGKALSHKGTPLRGGMPSGHSAVAFSIWTLICFSTPSHFIIILSFLLSFLIALSRLNEGIHTLIEVTAGGLLGFSVTLVVLQFFK